MKKILSILCAAVVLICSTLPITASASLQSDLAMIDSVTLEQLNEYPYYIVLSGYYYGFSTTYTRVNAFSSAPDLTTTFYSSAYCNIRASDNSVTFGTGGYAMTVSASQICLFSLYDNPSESTLMFQEMCTNIPGAVDYIKSLVTSDSQYGRIEAGSVQFEESVTFSEAYSIVTTPEADPTESPSSDGFQLPEEWISGGHTIPPTETETFASEIDPEAALDVMLESTESIPSTVTDAIGGFWWVFDKFLDATGLMWFVLFSLTIVCISWFFGRRV